MLHGRQPDVVRGHPCLHLSRVPEALIAGASNTHHVPNRKDAFSPLHLPPMARVIRNTASTLTLSAREHSMRTTTTLNTRAQAGQPYDRPPNRPAGGNQRKSCRRAKAQEHRRSPPPPHSAHPRAPVACSHAEKRRSTAARPYTRRQGRRLCCSTQHTAHKMGQATHARTHAVCSMSARQYRTATATKLGVHCNQLPCGWLPCPSFEHARLEHAPPHVPTVLTQRTLHSAVRQPLAYCPSLLCRRLRACMPNAACLPARVMQGVVQSARCAGRTLCRAHVVQALRASSAPSARAFSSLPLSHLLSCAPERARARESTLATRYM